MAIVRNYDDNDDDKDDNYSSVTWHASYSCTIDFNSALYFPEGNDFDPQSED